MINVLLFAQNTFDSSYGESLLMYNYFTFGGDTQDPAMPAYQDPRLLATFPTPQSLLAGTLC